MAKLILAPISPETAKQVGKKIGAACVKFEGAKLDLLTNVTSILVTVTGPLSAKQWDKQIAPDLKASLSKGKVRGQPMAAQTQSNFASMAKTVGLAVINGVAQPLAGESLNECSKRMAELLPSAKLPDGSPVWEGKKGRPTKAKGSNPPKSGSAAGGATSGGISAGGVADDEGGMNEAPKLRAAAILLGGDMANAQRLHLAVTNYREELFRWMSSILSDDDKAKLATLTAPKADEPAPKASKPGATPSVGDVPETALAAALIDGQAKANRRQRKAA